MNKQELIEELKKEIEVIRNNTDWEERVETYGKGKRVGLEFGWMLAEKLDEPEITEEQGFLEHLTRLFKKHGYDHLGQVALALENDLEISINKELPVIPQFVADWFEVKKYNLEDNIDILVRNTMIDGVKRHIETWMLDKTNKPIETLISMLDGYTIEPPKTLQVIVKNYDSTVYKTELPEDEVMKLIEGWRG